MSFNLRLLTVAIAAISASSVHAAGLDRSTQPSWGFVQEGTFAYVEHVTIDPSIAGKDNKEFNSNNFTAGNDVPDMANDYQFLNFGAKADINDRLSIGAYFDQPWGADVTFSGNNNFGGAANLVANGAAATVAKTGNLSNINNLADAKNFIAQSEKDLAEAPAKIAAGEAALADGRAKIQAGEAQLSESRQKYLKGLKDFEQLKPFEPVIKQLGSITLPNGNKITYQDYLNIEKTLAEAPAKLAAGEAALAAGRADLQKGEADLADGKKKYAEGLAKQGDLEKFKNAINLAAGLEADKGYTSVKIDSQNFTALMGVKLTPNFQIFGGPALQKVDGELHLRGNAFEGAAGYDGYIPTSTAMGWVAGMAYTKPEIALKASLTYRSEIEHDATITEVLPAAPLKGFPEKQTADVTITTPQSVNLDFQTGLNQTTLLSAKVRWVPWSDFAIKPPLYGSVSGLNIVNYDEDSWTAEVGVGKKLTDRLAVSGAVGWDSGAGNPVSALGPVEGNWNVGLGARFNITPEWSVSGGAKYLMFGDAKAKLPNGHLVGDFTDNDGWVYGLRLTYQKK